MSELKRYGIDPKYCSIEEFEDGQYVSYESHASLRAEVERSRDQYNGIIDTQLKVIEELKAEVERLKEFIAQIPAEARIKVVTDANKGRWDGCPPSDEYIRQMRADEEGKQP